MPAPRPAIKARVEVPAIIAGKEKIVTISSEEKGMTIFIADNIDIRFDDEVLQDALVRVQQSNYDVIGGPPNYGGAIRIEKHEETFEGVFEPGQKKVLQVHPICAFRASALEIDEADEDIIVENIRVGVEEQLTDTVPLQALEGRIALDTCMPGCLLTFALKNVSTQSQHVKFRIVGERIG